MFDWGSGNYGITNGTATPAYIERFMTATRCMRVNISADQAAWSRHCAGSYQTMPDSPNVLNAKSIIIWGSNVVVSGQPFVHFFTEAKQRGAKIIVIDPLFTATAAKADEFIPIRPGADGLLTLGMEKLIMQNEWYDAGIF